MISFKHQFTSAKADGPDSTQVQPSNWNAEHLLTMATARLLGRSTAGTGVVEEISVHSSLMLSAGVLALATNPTVAGNLIVSGTLAVGGTSQFTGAAQFLGGMTVTGAVGVGGAAAASAAFDVQSTTKGFLMPRMTTAQRDAIVAPAAGLLVFNTTTIQLEVFSSGAWRSATGANDIVPVGAISYFAGSTAPAGWLLCDGGVVTALYADLRAYLIASGSPYGTSGADPLLPDLRGEFIRGFDGGRGIDAGRVFGSSQLDAFQNHAHQLYGRQEHAGANGFINEFGDAAGAEDDLNITAIEAPIEFGGAGTPRVASETRPRNVALLACIKAFGAIVITGMADLAELLTSIATQPEAEAGLDNTKLMTPLRVADAITGRLASAAEAKAGTVTNKLMSPSLVKQVIAPAFTYEVNTPVSLLDVTLPVDAESCLIRVFNMSPVTSAAILHGRFSDNGGVSFDSGSNYRSNGGDTSLAHMILGTASANDTFAGADGEILILNYKDTTTRKKVLSRMMTIRPNIAPASAPVASEIGSYRFGTNAAVTHLRLFMSSGNIQNGVIRVYPIRH